MRTTTAALAAVLALGAVLVWTTTRSAPNVALAAWSAWAAALATAVLARRRARR
ncbi:hypothetical protein [Actinomyces timonensis]|uniref:hypothetical protein n=1 Tax=Actinomyces timonensis TaxID=1288391 RepID=UPI0003152F9E|nr:hypothetical protein [Actinomyces timonensis]